MTDIIGGELINPDTIVVEDGSGVVGANSYIDLDYLITYADQRGLTLPSTDDDKTIFLFRAMDYLESRSMDFQGLPTVKTQSLQWPRKDVSIDCELIDNNVIPITLKKAQCQLVVEQQNNTRLYPAPRTSSVEGLVTHKQVGPLTKKFAFDGKATANPNKAIIIASVEIFLTPLTHKGACCGHGYKQTIRL